MASISEAAAQLGCSVDTIRRRIRSGQIQATKSGNMWTVELTEELTPSRTEGEGLERLIQMLQGEVDELRRQLAVREEEVGRLHILLGQRQLESGTTRPVPWWKMWRR